MRSRIGSRPVPELSDKSLANFWIRVRVRLLSECWPWTGQVNGHGYGLIQINKGHYFCHRVAYSIANCGIPENSEVIRHTCDNRLCVNPWHLVAGMIEDNVSDRNSRNRQARGEMCARRKLTAAQVNDIRARYVRYGHPNLRDLSREFGVTLDQVHRIVSRKSWRLQTC